MYNLLSQPIPLALLCLLVIGLAWLAYEVFVLNRHHRPLMRESRAANALRVYRPAQVCKHGLTLGERCWQCHVNKNDNWNEL